MISFIQITAVITVGFIMAFIMGFWFITMIKIIFINDYEEVVEKPSSTIRPDKPVKIKSEEYSIYVDKDGNKTYIYH